MRTDLSEFGYVHFRPKADAGKYAPNSCLITNMSRIFNSETLSMQHSPVKPTVSIDDVERLDVRVGTILSVEDIPGSRKLMKLTVDLGDHQRTIVAGIKKERANPQEIEGLQALFVVNLQPQELAGVTSEGMLFDIGYSDGIVPVLAIPEKSVPNGARAG